ncbi:MAG: hypothetical protein WAV85_14115 [Rhodoferax sp.]
MTTVNTPTTPTAAPIGNTPTLPRFTTTEAALRAILAEVTPGTRPYSSDSYLPAHLIDAAKAALASQDEAETPTQQNTQIAQALDALRKANTLHMTGSNEAAIDLERKARLILSGLVETNVADTAAQQHAFNALSVAAWHCARGEPAQALARLCRAQSHIKASMTTGRA